MCEEQIQTHFCALFITTALTHTHTHTHTYTSVVVQFEKLPLSSDHIEECTSLANLSFTYFDVRVYIIILQYISHGYNVTLYHVYKHSLIFSISPHTQSHIFIFSISPHTQSHLPTHTVSYFHIFHLPTHTVSYFHIFHLPTHTISYFPISPHTQSHIFHPPPPHRRLTMWHV